MPFILTVNTNDFYRVLPWGIISMFLRNLVPDASPHAAAAAAPATNGTATELKQAQHIKAA